VFPELVRQLALWVLSNKDDAEEDEGPVATWRRFLADLGKDPAVDEPDKDDQDQWANDVSAAFARKYKFLNQLKALTDGEAA
jgi:hypothetical protein